MELWTKFALGTVGLVCLAQIVGGGDRALRARRWAALLYIPLMALALLRTLGWLQVPAPHVWSWLGFTMMLDQLVSEVRLNWRNRRARQPVA